MEQNQPLQMRRRQEAEQAQTIYVDGCKVTVRYPGRKTPTLSVELKIFFLQILRIKKRKNCAFFGIMR